MITIKFSYVHCGNLFKIFVVPLLPLFMTCKNQFWSFLKQWSVSTIVRYVPPAYGARHLIPCAIPFNLPFRRRLFSRVIVISFQYPTQIELDKLHATIRIDKSHVTQVHLHYKARCDMLILEINALTRTCCNMDNSEDHYKDYVM